MVADGMIAAAAVLSADAIPLVDFGWEMHCHLRGDFHKNFPHLTDCLAVVLPAVKVFDGSDSFHCDLVLLVILLVLLVV